MPKNEISSSSAHGRVDVMTWDILENSSSIFGVNLDKMDTETLKIHRKEIFNILKKDFEKDFEIIYPTDC